MHSDRSTAVIITARNAAATAVRAIESALAQGPVSEVVFVDDGSTDATSEVAAATDDGTGRLKIIRLSENRGPAHGRNTAIAASSAPFLCILDADDFMGEGRIDALFEAGAEGEWDLLADDQLFCEGPDPDRVFDRLLAEGAPVPFDLDLSAFAVGNLPRRDRPRRELGFLKPLIRRAFVDAHAIRYDERLRLGEDLLYYARCLIEGGRFRVVPACGYYAVQYPGSLSGHHRTEDVARLHEALVAFEAEQRGLGRSVGALPRYTRSTRNNLALRRALDMKRQAGWPGLLKAVRESPASLPYIFARVAQDKLSPAPARRPA